MLIQFLWVLGAQHPALAAEPFTVWLGVERAPGSEACPDSAAISTRAQALFPNTRFEISQTPQHAQLLAWIVISQGPEGQVAVLTLRGERRGERRFVSPEADCRGLADALAVALLLMAEPHSPKGEPPAPEATVSPPAQLAPASSRLRTARAIPSLEAGVIGGVGLLGNLAGGGMLGLGLWHPRGAGVSLRGLRLLAQSTYSRPEQSVTVDLWAVTAAACWRFTPSRAWSMTPCLELGWGSQRGQGSGYSRTAPPVRSPWLQLGPRLTLGLRVTDWLETSLNAGAASALVRQQYVVNDAQIVQKQEQFGGYLGIGLAVRWARR